jgi:hypothetical protein
MLSPNPVISRWVTQAPLSNPPYLQSLSIAYSLLSTVKLIFIYVGADSRTERSEVSIRPDVFEIKVIALCGSSGRMHLTVRIRPYKTAL